MRFRGKIKKYRRENCEWGLVASRPHKGACVCRKPGDGDRSTYLSVVKFCFPEEFLAAGWLAGLGFALS